MAWVNYKILMYDKREQNSSGHIFSAVISVKNKFQMEKSKMKTTEKDAVLDG